MEDIREVVVFKKKCKLCKSELGVGNRSPVVLVCTHVLCKTCADAKLDRNEGLQCFCKKYTNSEFLKSRTFVLATQKLADVQIQLENERRQRLELEERARNGGGDEEEVKPGRESFGCTKCDKIRDESEAMVCLSCDMKPLCYKCCFLHHLKKQHDTADYHPTILADRLRFKKEILEVRETGIGEQKEELKKAVEKMFEALENGEKTVTNTIEIMGKCRRSTFQDDMFYVVSEGCRKRTRHMAKLESMISLETKKINVSMEGTSKEAEELEKKQNENVVVDV